jgi:hypothetical protein
MGLRLLFLALTTLLLCSVQPHRTQMPLPHYVLWAWERPEDLRFLDPKIAGVAYLAATLDVRPDGTLHPHYRQQPLRLREGTAAIPVVRIETRNSYRVPPVNSVVEILLAIARSHHAEALQIDYDARATEHDFYRAILRVLQTETDIPISVTALASWCEHDTWLTNEPIAEATPMLFRMGPAETKNLTIHTAPCKSSAGLSTDEDWPDHRPAGLRPDARIYIFNPEPWTSKDWNLILQEAKECR